MILKFAWNQILRVLFGESEDDESQSCQGSGASRNHSKFGGWRHNLVMNMFSAARVFVVIDELKTLLINILNWRVAQIRL
jgi:hypothetical protein